MFSFFTLILNLISNLLPYCSILNSTHTRQFRSISFYCKNYIGYLNNYSPPPEKKKTEQIE